MSRSYQNIRCILFDFGGTLDADGIPWKEHFYPFYQKAGVRWPPEMFDKFFYASDDFITEKKLKNESYLWTLELQVSLVLKNGGAFDESLAKRIAQDFLDDSLRTLNRNRKTLERLKNRYRLGIVSNFYGNLPVLCEEAAIAPLFDTIVDSARVGCLKPDPKIFQSALDAVEVVPSNALFVGDSMRRDMLGAKSIGMPHVWLRSMNANAELKSCCPDDAVIHSVPDLEKILL